MTDKRIFHLTHNQARQGVADLAWAADQGTIVRFGPPTRTLEQNAAQWPILGEFSRQLKWPVDGELATMTDEEWKDVLTAAFRGDTVRLAKGLNGGVVMLGMRTSRFGVGQFSEWLEFLHATAAHRSVKVLDWSGA